MTRPDCDHAELEYLPRATVVDDNPPPFVYVRLVVRCGECHLQFHWRGLASGLPNRNEPVVSADGYELRAPIAPGPGAVVGLLDKTAMLDKLVEPSSV